MDRNTPKRLLPTVIIMSLSARRAWIEIDSGSWCRAVCRQSLSARRAWIEIKYKNITAFASAVALRKESVDRNR